MDNAAAASTRVAVARRRIGTAQTVLATTFNETREAAYARATASKFGTYANGMRERTVIHCFGDSHTRVYRRVRCQMRNIALTTTTVRGATAYGILNPDSKSGAGPRFAAAIGRISDRHAILIQLGEVDCGSLLWRLADRRGTSVDELAKLSLNRYFMFLTALDRSPLIISGVTPPTVSDYTQFDGISNPRYGLTASWTDRMELTQEWNCRVRDWCSAEGHVYLDSFDLLLTVDRAAIRGMFLPASPSDHHLEPNAYASYLASTALPRALESWGALVRRV